MKHIISIVILEYENIFNISRENNFNTTSPTLCSGETKHLQQPNPASPRTKSVYSTFQNNLKHFSRPFVTHLFSCLPIWSILVHQYCHLRRYG